MAYRRLALVGKNLNPKLSYKSLPTVPRNHNALLDLESYYRLCTAAATHTCFFLPHSSAVLKDKMSSFGNLSRMQMMSTVPEGKEKSNEMVETENPKERVKTNDADNINGEDKELMDRAVHLHRELVENEGKLLEVHIMLDEFISNLKGFSSFLIFKTDEEKVNTAVDILDDVERRVAKVIPALDKLLDSVEGGAIPQPFADKIEAAVAQANSIQVRMKQALSKCKKKCYLLIEMAELRAGFRFYLNFLFGGR